MASKYTLTVNGEATDFHRATKATVIAEADARRASGTKTALGVITASGTEVYALPKVGRVISRFTKPYTKSIELPKGLKLPKGYQPAYARPENDALVARNLETAKDERYAVVRVSTGEVVKTVPTTRDAGQVMKGMKPAKAA